MPVVRRADAEIRFETFGTSGPPVLLIQGVGVVGAGWTPQVRGLADRFRLATFDNRGIGGSAMTPQAAFDVATFADDAAAVLDELGWESAHVVGHSLGGVIAQRLAIGRRDRVRSLVAMCTVARGADAVRMTPAIMWNGIRGMVGTLRSRRRAFLELIYPKSDLAGLDLDALAAELAPVFGRDLAKQPPIAFRQVRALAAHDTRAELAALAGLPTLVMSATHDPIAPPRYGRGLAAAIPGAVFEESTDASHGLPIQWAERVNSRLAAFWDEADRARD